MNHLRRCCKCGVELCFDDKDGDGSSRCVGIDLGSPHLTCVILQFRQSRYYSEDSPPRRRRKRPKKNKKKKKKKKRHKNSHQTRNTSELVLCENKIQARPNYHHKIGYNIITGQCLSSNDHHTPFLFSGSYYRALKTLAGDTKAFPNLDPVSTCLIRVISGLCITIARKTCTLYLI